MSAPEKPQPITTVAHDYTKCRDYLEAKYGYRERDVLGKFRGNPDAEYRDFWHWVVEKYEPHRGCYIVFSRAALEGDYAAEPDWVRTIYGYYLAEFADGNGRLKLWVNW